MAAVVCCPGTCPLRYATYSHASAYAAPIMRPIAVGTKWKSVIARNRYAPPKMSIACPMCVDAWLTKLSPGAGPGAGSSGAEPSCGLPSSSLRRRSTLASRSSSSAIRSFIPSLPDYVEVLSPAGPDNALVSIRLVQLLVPVQRRHELVDDPEQYEGSHDHR